MSTINGNGNSVHPFFLPKSTGTRPSGDSGFDQNDGRRKRQRTISPARQSTTVSDSSKEWADKLKAAVSGEDSSLTERSFRKVTEDRAPEGAVIGQPHEANKWDSQDEADKKPASVTDGGNILPEAPGQAPEKPSAMPGKKLLRVRPDGKLASPKSKKVFQDVTPTEKTMRVRSSDKQLSPRDKSPPKEEVPSGNTIGLCSDGTLGLSVAVQAAADMKPKRGRRPTKMTTNLKSLVAVIRYGTDEASRVAVARAIDNVLSGRQVTSIAAREKPAAAKEPRKATHPFFTGGAARSSDQISFISNEEQHKLEISVSLVAQQQKAASPRKARVTSKPPEYADNSRIAIPPEQNAFGSNHAQVSRFPGAVEPLWPPLDMVRIGPTDIQPPSTKHVSGAHNFQPRVSSRKFKGVEIIVPAEEEVLKPYLDLVGAHKVDMAISQNATSCERRRLLRPLRRLMTGNALQKAVTEKMSTRITRTYPDADREQDVDELSGPRTHQPQAHRALQQVFDQIPLSSTAFDRFECETLDWVHKYSPKTAESVLQEGRDVLLLRDWLKGLTITSTGNLDSRASDSCMPRRMAAKALKRKRKKAEELDGFVVSSGDEQIDELTDPENNPSARNPLGRTNVRGMNEVGLSSICDRSANAVVISGPHGCGKTAGVYAAAQELGFEVFEINAGSRRSGRDILDKVGDMTRNHLVKQASRGGAAMSKDENEKLEFFSEGLKQDLESGRQGTINSIFSVNSPIQKKQLGSKVKAVKASPQKKTPKKQEAQKQSLILLEEVDVLFEEDKAFWQTILDLVLQSKRPVVMTCTDESLLPLDEMVLYAILRLTAPPEQIAVDYLLLVACNEGHLLSRDAVSALYRAKGSDLRASIAELNFFCQMAVGDTKGGLEWMHIRPPADDSQGEKTGSLRVVSDGTYQPYMGFLSREGHSRLGGNSIHDEIELLSEVWNGWSVDVGASTQYLLRPVSVATTLSPQKSVLKALQSFEQAAEALSTTDTFLANVCRQPNNVLLETAVPDLTDKARSSHVEGSNILLADHLFEYSKVGESLSLTLRACANQLLQGSLRWNQTLASNNWEQWIARMLPDIVQERRSGRSITKSYALAAFEPIARPTNTVSGVPKGPQISSLDGPMAVIAEDVAPYLRSIVSYDLRLEEQRRELDSLLAVIGKHGKKARTTRSSRAALEGGQKAHTRRERWFPILTDINMVLQSGGTGWQDALQQIMIGRSDLVTAPQDSDGSPIESDV